MYIPCSLNLYSASTSYASAVTQHASAVSFIHSYSMSYFQGHRALRLYYMSSLIFSNILHTCHQGDQVPLSSGSNEYISFHNHVARWIFCVLRSEPDQDFHSILTELEVWHCRSVVQVCCLKCHLICVAWAPSQPYQMRMCDVFVTQNIRRQLWLSHPCEND